MRRKLFRPRRPKPSRIRIQSYAPSKSAKELSHYLGIRRIQHTNSRFIGRPQDVIINWGNVKHVHNSFYLNPLDAVQTATNKLATFRALSAANVSIPMFYTSIHQLDPDTKYLARTDLFSHSGQGIIAGIPSELPDAPLYTKFVDKVAEYRAIVVGSSVVDFKQKKRKSDWDAERDPHIWNCSQGYVFARNDINHPPEAYSQAIAAVQALGLRYAAVDIIEDSDGTIYILELNTAYGLAGTTTQLVGDAILTLANSFRI